FPIVVDIGNDPAEPPSVFSRQRPRPIKGTIPIEAYGNLVRTGRTVIADPVLTDRDGSGGVFAASAGIFRAFEVSGPAVHRGIIKEGGRRVGDIPAGIRLGNDQIDAVLQTKGSGTVPDRLPVIGRNVIIFDPAVIVSCFRLAIPVWK